jgi:hypothetical protein
MSNVQTQPLFAIEAGSNQEDDRSERTKTG